MSFRKAISSVAGLMLSACAASASIAADWPARPIRVIVAAPAGGGLEAQ